MIVKETQNLHRQERAWDDSVLLQGKEEKKVKKKKKERKGKKKVVSQVVANLRNPFCSVVRVTPWHELTKGLGL